MAFIRIPKTASRSIGKVFGELERHKTAKELALKDSGEFSFAIVRHPYTRFVSGYYHCHYEEYKDINQLLTEDGIDWCRENHQAIFRPQWEFVYDGDELLVDYIGRFESLEATWKEIKQLSKIKTNLPPKQEKNEVRAELTNQSKQVIHDYYKKDFDLFNYEA